MSAVEDRTVAEGRAARSDQFGPGAWLGGDVHEKLPEIEFAFPGPLRDSLLTAIESGAKTATSSLLLEYELAQEPLPAVGDRGIVVDSDAAPRCVLETTDVSVVRLADVPLDHAFAEGEGYESVDDWRGAHSRFWTSSKSRQVLDVDFELTDETLVVLERFKIVR